MATVVISLWARLTTRVRSLAVAKGTEGCKESGGGNRERGEAWAVLYVSWRRDAASGGEGGMADGRGPLLLSLPGSQCFSPCGRRMDSSDWGGGAQRHQTHPSCETPPPLTRPLP